MIPAELLDGRVLVAGAGVSGRGCARLLADAGVDTIVADDNAQALSLIDVPGITVAEARARLAEFSLVVTSPGWRPSSPLLVDVAAAGIEVIGDVELAYRLDRTGAFGAPRTWLVVTGTNGKTTTTAMLAAMMDQASARTDRRAEAVGNIGVSVADAIVDKQRIDVLVAELSSFQLHWSSQFTPDAGVLLNLAEDHIDWHGSFDAYANDKARALTGPIAVAGIDDPHVRSLTAGISGLIGFTLEKPGAGQFGVVDGQLVDNTGTIPIALAPIEGIEPAGPAGILDALAAAALARSQGVSPAEIAAALAQFQVADHRGQVVASGGGVRWIDNSKATNPHAAEAALGGLANVIWIAGGQLKGADVSDLVRHHGEALTAAGLLGADAALIAQALAEHAPHVDVFISDSTDPVIAMDELVDWAAARSHPGDTVLLAPAAASLDMYTGMGQRGDLFTAAANRHAPRAPKETT
ncbi:UDP-N-acetylmuramoyl-L-alanine--D-glutamate ligase [Corynebacterium testudinoris]|uniref:UDP-N-acetylmuramoylalanine--D-glutamate ligase n=1 Tax=Corynebacterium testudinoris TaxID=136857 RepID=A0A0G3HDL6_9CORY|nr:UDP-N-acetylmuramoyl-L-alanine--D-glutamate ligase [Corynebacterium testudinoris]AKK09217.1 UDP-N-acetylmuramoylalanine--D-glutamate ligase [Corynebacterium testudinoris]MBX8996000.1 UDP-N-acetylmuramoyl-L-alanine--D-glutamate ligase [Corynebacterium testudinoris]